ncbi:MAG: GntR family transcriptional regulator [Noviherbaspirillum sp.]
MNTKITTRHHQVARRIVSDIRSGQFAIGSLLPSEPILAAEYGVSRSTLRAALATLQSLGIVDRKRGAGTRVCASEAAPIYVHSMIASGDLMQFAGPSTRHIQEIERLVADEALALRLDERPGRRWVRIGQTRHIANSDTPVCWTDVYLSAEYSDLLNEIPTYDGLIYTLIEQRYGVMISEISQRIRAIDIPPNLMTCFGSGAGTKALELTRRYRSSSGHCEMISISVLPEKTYSYEITLTRKA